MKTPQVKKTTRSVKDLADFRVSGSSMDVSRQLTYALWYVQILLKDHRPLQTSPERISERQEIKFIRWLVVVEMKRVPACRCEGPARRR